ncbi:hypothetical protein ACHAXT_003059 [Thalassiosira profunda]
MAKDQKFPPARRTSSIAYDNGCQEKYNRVDLWRKRRNLPPTALSSSSSSREEEEAKPIYTVGVLADIQYAPIPDGHSYAGNPRYYRHAKEAAKHAAEHFQEEGVQCVLNLGDIIDGKCSDVERWGGSVASSAEGDETSEEEMKMNGSSVGHEAIDDVLEALSAYNLGQILHTYGNHELYNLSREELGRKLSIPFTLEPTNDLVGYYDHLLHEPQHSSSLKVRFLVLDSYDVCLLDRCAESSHKRQAAHKILAANNHNYPEEENSPEGLEGTQRRFVGFNGGVDEPQMEWLKNSLQTARENDERVIICSHQPLHPDSTWPTCLVWNYEEVLTILRSFNDVVAASFSGHAHKGGYVRDESGIHFRVFPAVLESPHPVKTYALLDVHESRLIVRGMGDCISDVYDLDHLTAESGADA